MDSSNYSRGDKLLHHLALGSPLVSKMSFEVDSLLGSQKNMQGENHVFISGLARAGTTILMRLFYETGQFSSLTYRDMPFVLMPRLWRKLSSAWWKGMAATERAHSDGILVDYDSPEAFEEVFWRVFAGERYISDNSLRPHPADGELIEQFRIYIGNILSASAVAGSRRYLSKNNNNILRLPAIRKAFPNSLILIPFREPVAQAMSLLTQHRKFCALQQQDRFTQDYMQWLAHHEFGLSHKPFIFSAELESRLGNLSSDTLEYWLEIWIGAYQYLVSNNQSNGRFLCYEDLCTNPAQTLAPHFYSAGIELNADQINRTIRCATTAAPINIDQDIEARADKVYSQMRELANIHY